MKSWITLIFLIGFSQSLLAQGPTFFLEKKYALQGELVDVAVGVKNFENIVSLQFTLTWDETVLAYQSKGDYQLPHLTDFNIFENFAGQGNLTFVWFDQDVAGIMLPDSTYIFSLTFEVVGEPGDSSVVAITSELTPAQVGVLNGISIDSIPAEYHPGIVWVIEPVLLQATLDDNPCWGDELGAIALMPGGGLPPYQYNWSGPGEPFPDSPQISGLVAGIYSVTVTDADGNIAVESYLVGQPPAPLAVEEVAVTPTDCDQPTGTITLQMSGGTPPYLYDFGSGNTSDATASGLSEGSYFITISDVNGCLLEAQAIVEQAEASQLSLGADAALCEGGSLSLSAQAGLASYQWYRDGLLLGETGPVLQVDEPGAYVLEAFNGEGCSATDTIAVSLSAPDVSLGNDTILCEGTVLALTADPSFQAYRWYLDGAPLPAGGPALNVQAPGLYEVEVENEFGCTASAMLFVEGVAAMAGAGPDTTIFLGDTVRLEAFGGLSYQWQPSDILSCADCPTPNALPLLNTIFTVVITTEEGCVVEAAVEIKVEERAGDDELVIAPTFISPNGDGTNDGLYFERLENYPQNRLTVYNRWGTLIYSAVNYQLPGGDPIWDGTYKGKPLPAGIYYYILVLGQPDATIKRTLTIVRGE